MNDPNNLEGTRTREELADNFRKMNRIAPTAADKFALMFGHKPTTPTMSQPDSLPPGLPPLPPIPKRYGCTRWIYRGTEWNPGEFSNFAYYKPGLSDKWVLSFGMKPMGSSGHYLEAVRDEPASPETCPKCGAERVFCDGWNCPTEGCDKPSTKAKGCDGWKSIESVPLKTDVLLYWPPKMGRVFRPEQQTVGQINNLCHYAGATHWMQLPQPPEGCKP